MIKILQLSDLHIVRDADWNNLSKLLLKTARDNFSALGADKKLLIITGDFHFYNESDYDKSIEFIEKMIDAMEIDKKHDVFLIPGNHDICPAKEKRELIQQNSVVKNVKSDITLLQEDGYIDLLLERFDKYSEFCEKLGIYSDKITPASVHIRTWRNKLDIIHVNTCIVADGKEKQNQLLDTKTITALDGNEKIPCIALGHNSFYDLHEEVRKQISAVFYRMNVKAYLCGDKHKLEDNRDSQYIWLTSGYGDRESIPNIVCCRSSTDVNDDYSDIGCMIHKWDENSGKVDLEILRWESKVDQSKFKTENNPNAYNLSLDHESNKLSENQTQDSFTVIDPIILEKYQNYIRLHCSEIELNGLPTQSDDIAKKYELSKLFVPLRFKRFRKEIITHSMGAENLIQKYYHYVHYVRYVIFKGDGILSKLVEVEESVNLNEFIPNDGNFKYLVLSDPGAGKTTLLKRIASTYIFPNEYMHDSKLTERNIFPIWIRCRDIKNQNFTIWREIQNIPVFGEWSSDSSYTEAFTNLVKHHLVNGTALLLIDGLDEIGSDDGRKSFVEHLKNFINSNPKVNVIITSREKGFSVVTDNAFKDFLTFRIADLNDDEIKKLCHNWFSLVYGNSEDVMKDREKLTNKIINDERLKRLAKNPLMLTTLLLIDRRTGSLPNKRAGLYSEATKVLLETWNSAYHQTNIDLEEAKYQLAYVAFQMISNYEKYNNKINKSELKKLLRDVRSECSNLVSGNIGSISDVIDVVQRRSALLIQTGSEQFKDGHTEPVYEFQHLTFEEYLAAYAVTEGCFPRSKEYNKSKILEKYFSNPNMKEVILLTAAISPECAKNLTETILKKLSDESRTLINVELQMLLLQFVADEVSLSPEYISNIFDRCLNDIYPNIHIEILKQIISGKFKRNLETFFLQYDEKYCAGYDYYASIVPLLSGEIGDFTDYFSQNCHAEDDKQRAKAFSVLYNKLFYQKVERKVYSNKWKYLATSCINALEDKNIYIKRRAFQILSLGKFVIVSNEIQKYLDNLAYFIMQDHGIPPTVSFYKFKVFDTNTVIRGNITFSEECYHTISNYIATNDAYYKDISLLLLASIYGNNDTELSQLYSQLYDKREEMILYLETSNKSVKNSLQREIKNIKLLVQMICSSPSATDGAKKAVKEYQTKIENSINSKN